MVLLSQVTDPLTLLAPIQGDKKDRQALLCLPLCPLWACSSRRSPMPQTISSPYSFGHNAFLLLRRIGDTDKKWRNPKNARLRHHWTCQEGFRKNGGRFRSGQRSDSALSTFGIGSVPSTFLYAPLIISIYYSRHWGENYNSRAKTPLGIHGNSYLTLVLLLAPKQNNSCFSWPEPHTQMHLRLLDQKCENSPDCWLKLHVTRDPGCGWEW